jgi:hypothetical protein
MRRQHIHGRVRPMKRRDESRLVEAMRAAELRRSVTAILGLVVASWALIYFAGRALWAWLA